MGQKHTLTHTQFLVQQFLTLGFRGDALAIFAQNPNRSSGIISPIIFTGYRKSWRIYWGVVH